MKSIKKTQRMVAVFLTYVFMFPMIYSCTQEKEMNQGQKITYEELSKKYQGISDQLSSNLSILNKKFNQNVETLRSSGVEITQVMIDEYAVSIGYEPGFVSLSLVENVIEASGTILANGLENYVNDIQVAGEEVIISDFTKQKLIQITEGVVLSDLDNNQDFLDLQLVEKEMITVLNVFAEETQAQQAQSRIIDWDDPWIGGTAGVIVGAALLGPVGSIVGFFVGMFVQSLIKQ